MPKKDPKSPATTSLAYDVMLPRWEKISTLLAGTEAMREAGRAFLPQHPEEGDQAYLQRLSCCTLLNMVDMTLTSLVSKPFASLIKVGDDVPQEVKDCLSDIDMQGNSLDRFARAWFREGVAKGYAGVLAEFPRTPARTDGQPRTAEDDQKENLRPYLVHLPPESMISGDVEVIAGREVLTELRIFEQIVVRDGFAQVLRDQIRVITPGNGEVYQKRKQASGKVEWVVVERYTYDLDFIPAVIFYADRQGFMLSKPPLLDLANLNIRHWQSTSDQIAVLTVARFPMLGISGAIDTEELVVGPNNLMSVTDPAGRFYYIEHSGKAIAAGRQDLLDLEESMAEYGATFMKKRPGNATATARAIDSADVTSALQDMSLGFQDALNQVMFFFGRWLGLDKAGTFKVKTDFGLSNAANESLSSLVEARRLKDISRTQFLTGLIHLGVLSEDFPMDQNVTELKSEPDFMPEPTPAGGAP